MSRNEWVLDCYEVAGSGQFFWCFAYETVPYAYGMRSYAYEGHSQGAIRVRYAAALSQSTCVGDWRMGVYEDAHTRMGVLKEENYSGDTRMSRLIRVWVGF